MPENKEEKLRENLLKEGEKMKKGEAFLFSFDEGKSFELIQAQEDLVFSPYFGLDRSLKMLVIYSSEYPEDVGTFQEFQQEQSEQVIWKRL